jgi:hypothetical protein
MSDFGPLVRRESTSKARTRPHRNQWHNKHFLFFKSLKTKLKALMFFNVFFI